MVDPGRWRRHPPGMRMGRIVAVIAAGVVPLAAFAQDGGAAPAAKKAKAEPAAVAKKKATKPAGVTKRPVARKKKAPALPKAKPAPKPAAVAHVTPAEAKPAAKPAIGKPGTGAPATADPELVATAKLFFQGLTSQVPAAMAALSGYPFDLDGEKIGSKSQLVGRLTTLFQGKDFSSLPNFGVKTLPAAQMVKTYGPPPARLGKLDLTGAWVGIADLGGHGYVAVFKKKYGRWVAIAYTD